MGEPAAPAAQCLGSAGMAPSASQDMLDQGYVRAEDYAGILSLSRELREKNKLLRAEIVTVRVEHERLLAEDAFLREAARENGLEQAVPPLVVSRPPTAHGRQGGLSPAPE